jgi:hypothetical protein
MEPSILQPSKALSPIADTDEGIFKLKPENALYEGEAILVKQAQPEKAKFPITLRPSKCDCNNLLNPRQTALNL